MQEMPRVWILAADTVQVRTGAFGAPQEGAVVHVLTGLRVLTVSFGLGTHRPHHLRVAADASLTDIEIAAFEFQRRIGSHRRDRRNVRPDERSRYVLHDTADE